MMRKRRPLAVPGALLSAALCLAAWLPAGSARSSAPTPDQVRAAVETWVRTSVPDPRPGATVSELVPYPAKDRPAAWIASLAGGGFCFAGADDRLLPVTLYSPGGDFDPDCPDFAHLLQDISGRLERIEAAAASADPDLLRYADAFAARREDWSDLVAGRRPAARAAANRDIPLYLSLPVTSRWHQFSPYNDQCPEVTPSADEHVVVGCTATAMAQIMRYWEWPTVMDGPDQAVIYDRRYSADWISEYVDGPITIPNELAGRLEWIPDGGGQLRMKGWWDDSILTKAYVIPGGSEYIFALEDLWLAMNYVPSLVTETYLGEPIDWSLLQDVHADPVDASDVEAAKLCRHVAVAANMQFGLFGSSSNHGWAEEGYENSFRYDPDCHDLEVDDAVLVQELTWLRPVQMSGQDPAGGHDWVVLGYYLGASTIEYQINIGWRSPSEPFWCARDSIFPDIQRTLIDIAPADVVRFVGGTLGEGDGSPLHPYPNLALAAAGAPDGATLIFQTGSDNVLPGTSVTVNRPMTLKGIDVTVRPQ